MSTRIDGIEYEIPPTYTLEDGASGTWCKQCQDLWLGERLDCPNRAPDTPAHAIEHVAVTTCPNCVLLAPSQVASHETSERHKRSGVPMYRAGKPLKRSTEDRYGDANT